MWKEKLPDMKEECLICKAPLEYLQEDILMECSICHKSEHSKTRCVNGHYVCNECHSKGVDSIVGLCLNETSCDPIVNSNQKCSDFGNSECSILGIKTTVLLASAVQ